MPARGQFFRPRGLTKGDETPTRMIDRLSAQLLALPTAGFLGTDASTWVRLGWLLALSALIWMVYALWRLGRGDAPLTACVAGGGAPPPPRTAPPPVLGWGWSRPVPPPPGRPAASRVHPCGAAQGSPSGSWSDPAALGVADHLLVRRNRSAQRLLRLGSSALRSRWIWLSLAHPGRHGSGALGRAHPQFVGVGPVGSYQRRTHAVVDIRAARTRQ